MPFHLHAKGVTAQIRLTPAARQTGVFGLMPAADGKVALKAAVTAPPEDGKANKELIRMLAKEWGVPKSSLSLLAGETNRNKTVLLETANGTALLEKLRAWLAARD